jgi:hypothetical protein
MTNAIPATWREYRRRHLAATFGLVAGFPCVIGIAIAAKLAELAFIDIIFPVLMAAWALVWGVLAFRLVRWPCPRCGRPWLSHQAAELGVPRQCAYCHLKLYQAT